MAPNRKQLALALDPLVNTQPLVQAKYLPLTAESNNYNDVAVAPQSQPEPTTIIRSNNVDDDYWTWEAAPAETPSAPVIDLFSADHIVANLAKEAARLASTTPIKTVRANNNNSDHEDYWAERVEARYSPENTAISNNTGYWDWPNAEEDASAVQIALILKEEFARQQTSGERMEERLRQDAATYKHSAPQESKAENDDYWNWESATVIRANPNEVSESYWEWDGAVESEQTKKERLIANLLAYEKARSLLSGEHLEDVLKENAQSSLAVAATMKASSDSYWNWPAQEDDYWNMRPLPATVVAEAPKGYWDW